MTQLSILDALMLAALTVALPVLGVLEWRRFLAACGTKAGVPRLVLYRSTMVQAWLVAFAVLAVFLFSNRSPGALGLQWPGGPWLLWAVLALAGLVGALFWSFQSARRASPAQHEQVRAALGPMAEFMPRNKPERRLWSAMSVTAGITEEVVFRGYLLWLFSLFVPTLWAVVPASVLFGLQHAYQGPAGVFRTTLLGAFMCALYLASGSLLIPILAHILIDLLQGETFSACLRANESDRTSGNVPAREADLASD